MREDIELSQTDVPVHIAVVNIPLDLHLLRRVAETLKPHVALLNIVRVEVEVHAAGHVIVDTC